MSYGTTRSSALTWDSGRQAQAQMMERARAEMRSHGSANWFIWTAGLSLLNSLFALLHFNLVSGLGLTITQIVDRGATSAGGDNVLAAGVDVLAIAVFLVLGLLARGHRQWAFVVGLVLYLADTVLLAGIFGLAWETGVATLDIRYFVISAAIHGYTLYRISQGAAENQRYRELGRLLDKYSEAPLTPPRGPEGPTYIVSY